MKSLIIETLFNRIIKMRLIFSLIICITTVTAFKECNFSQFDFFSTYALGKQDQLNRTFTVINQKVRPLSDVTYVQSIFNYAISQTKAQFSYIDSFQKAEVVYDDAITISGGKLDAFLTFNWSKNSVKGRGNAYCQSQSIAFAKLFYFDNGFINYKVLDYVNISFFRSTCNITRLDYNLEPTDIEILNEMLNYNDGNNIKEKLQEEIALNYYDSLSASLYDQRQPINSQYEYTWVDTTPGKKNMTIKYTTLPVGAHLRKTGLLLSFVTQITDDDRWKCGAAVPSQPKDPKIYGGIQQYLSLSVLQNSVRFAVQLGILDAKLNKQNWQSKVFQFYAGDLYEVIPYVASKHYANQPVTGSCQATTTNLKLTRARNSTAGTLLLSMHYNCELKIKDVVISQFDVDPNFIVQVVPQSSYLDFYVIQINKFAHFKDVGQYVIHDLSIANLFITRCLQRLFGGKVFGSGWKIYARDYPQVRFQDEVMFIYDSSAIE